MATRSVLVMTLGGRRCGVPAGEVAHVARAVALTALPGAPAIAEGVVDFHGEIVPVLDLRGRFGDVRVPVRPDEHLVIATVGARTVAFRADAVLGVVDLEESELQGPELGPGLRWAGGLARDEQGLVVLQDLARVLGAQETIELDAAIARLRTTR